MPPKLSRAAASAASPIVSQRYQLRSRGSATASITTTDPRSTGPDDESQSVNSEDDSSFKENDSQSESEDDGDDDDDVESNVGEEVLNDVEGMHWGRSDLKPLASVASFATAKVSPEEVSDWQDLYCVMARILKREPAQNDRHLSMFKELTTQAIEALGFDPAQDQDTDEPLDPDWIDGLGHLFRSNVPRADILQGPSDIMRTMTIFHRHTKDVNDIITAHVLQERQARFSEYAHTMRTTSSLVPIPDALFEKIGKLLFEAVDTQGVTNLRTIAKKWRPNIFVDKENATKLLNAASRQKNHVMKMYMHAAAVLLDLQCATLHKQVNYTIKLIFGWSLCEQKIRLYQLLEQEDEEMCRLLNWLPYRKSPVGKYVPIKSAILRYMVQEAGIEEKDDIIQLQFKTFYLAASASYITIGTLGWGVALMASSSLWDCSRRVGATRWYWYCQIYKMVMDDVLPFLNGPGEIIARHILKDQMIEPQPDLKKIKSMDMVMERFAAAGYRLDNIQEPCCDVAVLERIFIRPRKRWARHTSDPESEPIEWD